MLSRNGFVHNGVDTLTRSLLGFFTIEMLIFALIKINFNFYPSQTFIKINSNFHPSQTNYCKVSLLLKSSFA